MPYLRMVFQETLRLFPLSPIILRQLTGDIKLGIFAALLFIESMDEINVN